MQEHNGRRLEYLESALISGRIDRRKFIKLALAAGAAATGSLPALAEEFDAIRANQTERSKSLLQNYDYIVIGAGSAACALVGRLAKNTSAKILVVEAGDWDTAASIEDPRSWFKNLGTERDWGDVAIPQPGVNHRAIPEHTGRVLGGGSSINATIWVRPFKNDLEFWAREAGDDRWGYEHALKVYRSVENWQGTPSERYRGTGGPVWCQPAYDPLPIAPAMLEACEELRLPVRNDLNGEREEEGSGFALMNHIIKEGRRQSMAKAYLYPVMMQENVTVLVNTHVNRLLLDGDRCVGIECIRNGSIFQLRADRETVVCAGGFNTPKLLMLSGIGNEVDLKAVGIQTALHSPEVGKNLQDHILHGGCIYEPPSAMEYRNSAAEVSGYLKSDPSLELPDLSIVQIELPYVSDVIGKQYSPPQTSWALCGGLVAPKSRGTMSLRSSRPEDRPIITMNFLSHPDDIKALAASVELAREIAGAAALKPYVKREVVPGKKLSGAEMVDFVRNGATTYFHASGSCRMGQDSKAVVDRELRVNGIRNLRIADSSIMPRIASCPTMAACVFIGERMADILTAKA